ncbi:uncharacterized protein ACBR49_011019 [Aulostomus maculatus]
MSDPHLPLSSLRLMVPPLRLMSAQMWQVVLVRDVDQYGKLVELITLVTDVVPELMDYKQRTQLLLGLTARIILDFLKQEDPVDRDAIQAHLNIFQRKPSKCQEEESQDGEVETSKSAFVELVQTLLDDKYKKEKFLKGIFPELYGDRFDTMLQILLWEFFYRLEEFLSIPSFSKVSSMFDLSSFEFQFEQFVSDWEDLKKILQQQKQRQKLTKRGDHVATIIDENGGGSGDEETDNSSTEADPSNLRLQESGLSPLSSSLDSEDDHMADPASISVPESIVSLPSVFVTPLSEEEEPGARSVKESCRVEQLNLSSTPEETEYHTCPACGKSFMKKQSFRRHLRAEHPTLKPLKQLHRCDKCDKTFETKRRLEQHHQAHTKDKPYICSYCGKGLSCPKVLKTHLRLHTGERPYACKFCDKKFEQPYGLTQHVRLHKGEKPYLCSECGKAFAHGGAFLVHSRLHTGERPYHCKDCGKDYITLQRLKVHQRIHTNERPYLCPLCGKSFRIQSGLAKHKRIHSGERPYKCVACDKRFYTSHNLKIHMRSHNKAEQGKASTE